jgi:hypothetical protein
MLLWCLTFLTCVRINGQSTEMALAHADDACAAYAKRTKCWVAGP